MSTYPPRNCGVAAYTHDLGAAAGNREIVAIVSSEPAVRTGPPAPKPPKFPQQIEIHHRLRRDDRADHVRVAKELSRCVEVASIQHGPGIWGGEDGSYVLDFVRALDVASVVTLHAVPTAPSAGERAILAELVATTGATVVMSQAAAARLTGAYAVDGERVSVIPHGVLDLPLVDADSMKSSLELDGRAVILSFGLLGPGKGLEQVLEALPAVIATHPNACYVVVGATRDDLSAEGEAYRASLMGRVDALGLADHVRFVDRFVGRVELTRWLEAADVLVTPYRDLDKDSSGTLAYAMGAGRAVVSTPYSCAQELLADGRGVIVPQDDPARLAGAIDGLLGDDAARVAIGARAYAHTREMTWPHVAAEYRRLFRHVSAEATARRAAVGIAGS